jgi:ubiquinone/menaquinone biosynthesis C-methylase UbiE
VFLEAPVSVKQAIFRRVAPQFGRPTGPLGRGAGWIMESRASNRERNKWAVSLLDIQPSDRVLEIGFGPGVAIREIARIAAEGYVCGIDHSEVMVRQASRRNAEALRSGRVDLRLGSVESLPKFDEPFDKILAVNAIQFVADPVECLADLRALLVVGGRVAIAHQPRCPGATDETSELSGRRIAAQLAQAGFSDVRVETLKLKPAVVCVLAVNTSDPGALLERRAETGAGHA